MSKLHLLQFLAIALILGPSAHASTPDAKTWAVVVGVNTYQRTNITSLKYAVSDAELFATTLNETMDIPKERTFLYTTEAESPTERPRLTNLVYRLEWLKEQVKPEDTIIFYFAGHGVESEGETFLLMENADSRSKATLTMSTLNATLLFDLLEACKAKDTLVVLDACRNDPTAGRGSEDNKLTEDMTRGLVFKPTSSTGPSERQRATLFACSVGERSYEWANKGHGYFTYYLVEGLKSKSASSQNGITLGSLSNYVRKEVALATAGTGEQQQPSLRYDGPGPEEWILLSGQNLKASGQELGDSESLEARLNKALLENLRLQKENNDLKKQLQAITSNP